MKILSILSLSIFLLLLISNDFASAEVLKIWSMDGEFIDNSTTPPCSDTTVDELRRFVNASPLITARDMLIMVDAKSSTGQLIRKMADRTVILPEGDGKRYVGFWDVGSSTLAISVSLVSTRANKTRPIRINIIRRPEGRRACTTTWVGSGAVQ